ncbi:septum formation initiator family protein [Sporosarcina pasteurii]|uniref:Septum formation initiator n=2 Tax=Sporosarcina pasteurii TaxID=1474 RepID=A0A380BCX4_SPOPA|nr:septum formation initiator family protein [Sporosarcina pasteurii]SUI98288.1 Septum formation initiator [Sporosarcina pasteurii]
MVRKKTKQTPTNIAKIKNEYVRTLQQKEERKKVQKARLYRNLVVFAVIAIVSLGFLLNTFWGQKKTLAAKEQEKQALLIELAEKEEEHVMLKRQLEKLNDDEYIAKLARQEYFLSDKNEIIFSLPKKEEKDKKKDEEKE